MTVDEMLQLAREVDQHVVTIQTYQIVELARAVIELLSVDAECRYISSGALGRDVFIRDNDDGLSWLCSPYEARGSAVALLRAADEADAADTPAVPVNTKD